MSGFCGWLASDAPPLPAPVVLQRMAAALPGIEGGFADETAEATVGLALRGHAEESSWGTAQGIRAVVLGYPRWSDPDLAGLARRQGDATALLEAYRRYSTDLLDRVFGHFAFAVLDQGRGRAFCAIDRFGVYRLCLATPQPGHLVFATSADCVRAYPGVGATISPQTLYQYLFFIDRVAAPGNIYDEQSKLCPGEAILFEGKELKRWRYWQLDYRSPSTAPKAELYESLRERLEVAVARCLEDENAQETSCFLSGGLDSSSVAGFFAKVAAAEGRCVTIGFEHADFDETDYAKAAARHFGLKHEIFTVGPREVLAVLPNLATAFDEPYSNSSVVPCFYCAKVSKELGDGMILAGDGGDELFGGNTRYVKDSIFDHYARLPAGVRRRLVEPLLARHSWSGRLPVVRRLANYVSLARQSVAHRMTSHNAFAFTPVAKVFSAEAVAEIDLQGPVRFADALFDSAAGSEKIQRMMHLDLQLTLADSDLRKVVTSCTAAGTRVRFPMLDHELAAFSATLPADLLVENNEIRRFYKDALSGFLPRKIIDKEKMGFGLPMFQYIAELPALADFFCDALTDLKQRRFFDRGFLDRMVDAVRQGEPGTHAGVVWDLAVLEIWMASRDIAVDGTARTLSGPESLVADGRAGHRRTAQ